MLFGKKSLEHKLAAIPIDERLVLATSTEEDSKFRINTLRHEGSYTNPKNQVTIDMLGPYEQVPYFFAAKNSEEVNYIRSYPRRINLAVEQKQLVVQENGLYLRNLRGGWGHNPIQNGQTIFFYGNPRGTDEALAWASAVKEMVKYFIGFGRGSSDEMGNNKIIFGSEKCKDRLIEVFNELGLQKIT